MCRLSLCARGDAFGGDTLAYFLGRGWGTRIEAVARALAPTRTAVVYWLRVRPFQSPVANCSP
jgi:hypothetical protein